MLVSDKFWSRRLENPRILAHWHELGSMGLQALNITRRTSAAWKKRHMGYGIAACRSSPQLMTMNLPSSLHPGFFLIATPRTGGELA